MTAIPVAAIGRLNAFARTPNHWGEGLRNAIYAYKMLATSVLLAEGRATLRFVKWTGKCRNCTDGRWAGAFWRDGQNVACDRCRGTGIRTLRFTEATLEDGQIWHHPWEGRTSPGMNLAQQAGFEYRDDAWRTADGAAMSWQDAGEWQPLQPGQARPLDDVVTDLNEVEDWVEAGTTPPWPRPCHWQWKEAKRNLCQQQHRRVIGTPSHAYAIDLGRSPDGCFVCGRKDDLAGFTVGRLTRFFHWVLPVCSSHDAARPNSELKDVVPDSLMTPPVRRWLERHQRVEIYG